MTTRVLRAVALALIFATSLVRAAGIPREKWIDQFSTAWPTLICSDENGFFRACFSTSVERCEKVALSAVRVCLEKSRDEIPELITSREMAASVGTTIGKCAGTNLAIALSSDSSPNAKCENALKDLRQKMDSQKDSAGKESL